MNFRFLVPVVATLMFVFGFGESVRGAIVTIDLLAPDGGASTGNALDNGTLISSLSTTTPLTADVAEDPDMMLEISIIAGIVLILQTRPLMVRVVGSASIRLLRLTVQKMHHGSMSTPMKT